MILWALLVTVSDPIKISYSTIPSAVPDDQGKPKLETVKSPIREFSILYLSRTIHDEAEQVLYCYNTFEFPEFKDDLVLFLQSISPEAYLAINHVILHWPAYLDVSAYLPALDFLAGCRSLQTLVIHDFDKFKMSKRIRQSLSGLR